MKTGKMHVTWQIMMFFWFLCAVQNYLKSLVSVIMMTSVYN
jgi:hypothetical protein